MLTIVGYEQATCGCVVGRYVNTVTAHELACIEVAAAHCQRHRAHDPVTSGVVFEGSVDEKAFFSRPLH